MDYVTLLYMVKQITSYRHSTKRTNLGGSDSSLNIYKEFYVYGPVPR